MWLKWCTATVRSSALRKLWFVEKWLFCIWKKPLNYTEIPFTPYFLNDERCVLTVANSVSCHSISSSVTEFLCINYGSLVCVVTSDSPEVAWRRGACGWPGGDTATPLQGRHRSAHNFWGTGACCHCYWLHQGLHHEGIGIQCFHYSKAACRPEEMQSLLRVDYKMSSFKIGWQHISTS